MNVGRGDKPGRSRGPVNPISPIIKKAAAVVSDGDRVPGPELLLPGGRRYHDKHEHEHEHEHFHDRDDGVAMLTLLGFTAAGTVARGASSHQSGCHSQHTCPSDHHTYVWTDVTRRVVLGRTRFRAIPEKPGRSSTATTATETTTTTTPGPGLPSIVLPIPLQGLPVRTNEHSRFAWSGAALSADARFASPRMAPRASGSALRAH
jgi:hypothetical protein